MISCSFTDNGFTVSGHSGYADSGSDIVCAAVSAMVMLVCNILTDKTDSSAIVTVDDESGSVSVRFKKGTRTDISRILVDGLKDELLALSGDYPENIRVL